MRARCVLLFLALLCGGVPALAQAPAPVRAPVIATDTIREYRLRDGSIVIGRVAEETLEQVVVVTVGGARVTIPRAQIESVRVVSGSGDGERFWTDDPNHTRLFFTSTARPLEQGEGYISSFMLFFPFVAYGATDRFTIAGGTPIIPEAIGRIFYLAPKYTVIHRPKASFAVGGLGFVNLNEVDQGSLGILYGVGTWGSRDNAFTAGAGWGYSTAGSSGGISSNPVIVLGAEARASRRVKFITENWIFTGDGSGGLLTGGLRFIGDRLSADLGFGGFFGEGDGFCCIPLVNFVYNFGQR